MLAPLSAKLERDLAHGVPVKLTSKSVSATA